ncbi:DNA mismatch repair protein Mlh3 isoform X2 [Genypterus blacodes]|uniref:DNA mismatch repair protein Mlh3 isoform X2 n=1 Tax=Genypterus blacodes TaxID=154954 RepID=UPI003F75C091
MIKCLAKEVQGRLRSGVAIPSLQQCVEELILNSVDAGATCVCVRTDMDAFKVQVIDNGAGLSAEDLEKVGRRYHTSKCSTMEDLERLRSYGFRGEAVASIVALAGLVQISSRVESSPKTYVRIFKDGKGLDVVEAETSRPSAGTTFVICNFFHNMPVRRKRMDAVLEGERIRHRVEAVSLMQPSVSFTMKNDRTGAMMVQLPKARTTYHRFVQIHGLGRAQKLGEISYRGRQCEVRGHAGREGHYSNSLQLLYVNQRLLLKTPIHKLLNFLLRRLRSSNQRPDSPDGQTATRSPRPKRSTELHAVYVINIKCPPSDYDVCLEPAKTLIEFKDWDGVLLCVEEAVRAFLSRENLVAEFSRDDLDGASPRLFGSGAADREADGSSSIQDRFSIPTLDCTVGMKLASESVHRKRKSEVEEDTLVKTSVQMKSEEAEEGQKGLIEKEQGQNQSHTETECRDESQRESETLESVSDNNHREEEEAAVSVSDSVRPGRIEPMEHPTEGERRLGDVSSVSSVTLQDRSVLQGDRGGRNRKIRLSDPYLHVPARVHEPAAQQRHHLPLKPEERSCAWKRKVSLPHSSCAPAVPSKMPRVTSCQKVTLRKQSGSLDKFRRIYGKAGDAKPSAPLPSEDRPPETEGPPKSPKGDTAAASAFTELELISCQCRVVEKSLAAKLCHLKEQRTDGTTCVSRSSSEDDACPSGIQDANNNNNDDETNPNRPPGETEEATTSSGDWLHHYDASAGKTVYVNKVTGLSRYQDPAGAGEGPRALCTSDVTTVAVSVVSDSGAEHRCYPFQADLVLPFLPKSRAERVMSSGPEDRDVAPQSADSLSSLYSKWNNPVFVRPAAVGVDVSSGQAEGLAVKVHNILFPYRFSKAMIQSMKVLHQVDKKFLACLINTREEEEEEEDVAAQREPEGNLLVLVDQHAADERVRLEKLVADSYEDDPDSPGERRLCSSTILPPLEIGVTEEELRLLGSCGPHLLSLGLGVELSDAGALVGKVPLCFMEKERNELRRGRPSVIKPIVEEYLQEQLELLRSAGRVRGSLPLTVLKVLASLACHGAVKFNDALSRDECSSLVESLSSCRLPFQCAHGRPSIAPLVDVLHLDKEQKEVQKPNLQKLRRMYEAWQLLGDG